MCNYITPYQERQRDRPCEAQQPPVSYTHLAKIPVIADIASEFRYSDPFVDENTLIIIVSQSGETADTLAALRDAKAKGARVLSITNVVGSSIARESDDIDVYKRQFFSRKKWRTTCRGFDEAVLFR